MHIPKLLKQSVLAAGMAAFAGLAAAQVVYSNNPAPGDLFTNPTPVNQGMAVDSTGWYYNNVRSNGSVGINVAYPRSGNGSVLFNGVGGDAKADIEYLPNAVNIGGNYASNGSLGPFGALSSMAYEWYRDSSSTTTEGQHPSLRVLLDRDGDLATIGDRGGLVFERAYNSPTTAVDQWVSELITGSTFLWNFGLGLGFAANINGTPYPYDSTLSDWQAFMPSATIIGFSSGIGSGWGPFTGAVDNIAWTIGEVTTSANFEVQAVAAAVPEPTTLALMLSAVFGLGMARRGRRQR